MIFKTFEEFQAKRREVPDLGKDQGIPAQNGRRGFAYSSLGLIEEREDWLEGGVEYVVTCSDKPYGPMVDHFFKEFDAAERFLYGVVYKPQLEAEAAIRNSHIRADAIRRGLPDPFIPEDRR